MAIQIIFSHLRTFINLYCLGNLRLLYRALFKIFFSFVPFIQITLKKQIFILQKDRLTYKTKMLTFFLKDKF